jgi:hypothetical protein
MEADFLGADDTWFWCAVYDWAGQGYVYRVPLVGGHTQAYRLQPPGESVPDKAVFIDNGLVYQLLVTRNATAAKVLLIGPAS